MDKQLHYKLVIYSYIGNYVCNLHDVLEDKFAVTVKLMFIIFILHKEITAINLLSGNMIKL